MAGLRLAIIESSTGGQIQASVMQVPGASAVFVGGSVAYATRDARELLLNDGQLHEKLLATSSSDGTPVTKDTYVAKKREWAREAALRYARLPGVEVAVGEAGAMGPTFRPADLHQGFSALCVADKEGVLAERVAWADSFGDSDDSSRARTMTFVAERAATLAATAVEERLFRRDFATQDDASEEPRYVVVDAETTSCALVEDEHRLAFLSAADVRAETGLAVSEDHEDRASSCRYYLGRFPVLGAPVWAVMAPATHWTTTTTGSSQQNARRWAAVRTAVANLDRSHRDVALHAVAKAQYHRRHVFCSLCGGRTVVAKHGAARECVDCGAVHFPRQDPSIIVAVSSRDGSKCLLGRSPRHPRRVYTALAGFVEAGETFEAAVAREVFEETGVRVDMDSLKYVSSQPWPFPQSAMVGFEATADADAVLDIDYAELEDAKWFDKSDILKATRVSHGAIMNRATAEEVLHLHPDVPCLVPPPGVLARTLIDRWCHHGTDTSTTSSSDEEE